MRRVALLLRKDLRTLGRMPALALALVAYPLVIALVVGLVVRYAGERPRVALVDEHGALPGLLVVGETRFDVRARLAQATEVDLVPMSRARAERELDTGSVTAALVVPPDFITKLRGLRESPTLVLRTTRGGLGTRVVEKMRSLVYSTNLELQKAYIDANLAAVDLLLRGGSGTIGRTPFTLPGSGARALSFACSSVGRTGRLPRALVSSTPSWGSCRGRSARSAPSCARPRARSSWCTRSAMGARGCSAQVQGTHSRSRSRS